MKIDRFNQKILKSNSGVAIIMVTSAIALLTYLLAEFTFETKLNKIKINNLSDRLQAKLTAESGLRFSLAKMQIYREGRNFISKNKDAAKFLKPSHIEAAVTQPFFYPIPVVKNLNIIQRQVLEKFNKNTQLGGQLSLSMTPVTGFLNPNNLRVSIKDKEKNDDDQTDKQDESDEKSPLEYIESKLVETLTNAIEQRRKEDEDFDTTYGSINPELLIKELKYYVNKPEDFQDIERAELEAKYLAKDIRPKHAPLTSIDELYLLEGWDDEIVNLIKDKLTVHEVSVIPLNKITKSQLKIIFPILTPNQQEEFFKYRDGDEKLEIKAKEFESEEDFKNLLTKQLGLDEATYASRSKEFADAGLSFGVAGKLYKVVSQATKGRAVYTLTAFIDLPIKPQPEKKKESTTEKDDDTAKSSSDDASETKEEKEDQKEEEEEEEEKKEKEKVQELLSPRVIEIRVD